MTSTRIHLEGRVLVVDALVAALCAAGLIAAQALGVSRLEQRDAVLTAVLVIGPLGLRRTTPTVATAGVAIGVILTGGRLIAVDVAAFSVGAFSMAASAGSRRRSLAILALMTTAVGLWFALLGSPYAVGLSAVAALPAWVAGDTWRERRQRKAAQILAAQIEQEVRVQRAVSDERRRLARELHDIVAHDVGVMLVQTGAARQVLASSPERATDALLNVEAAGRAALVELRQLLDVLDEAGAGIARSPEPDLGDIEAMAQRLRDAGLPVVVRVSGEPNSISAELALGAYRIIQEALTNSMKYAGGAPTEIHLDYEPDALVVEVLDEGWGGPETLRPGRGIFGMRERAEALGGSLEAGPRAGHGFAVLARLPYSSGSLTQGVASKPGAPPSSAANRWIANR